MAHICKFNTILPIKKNITKLQISNNNLLNYINLEMKRLRTNKNSKSQKITINDSRNLQQEFRTTQDQKIDSNLSSVAR